MTLSGKTAIAGVGNTAFGKLPGRSAWSLQTEAVKRALDDAGLEKEDVDGLLTAPPLSEPLLLHAAQPRRDLPRSTDDRAVPRKSLRLGAAARPRLHHRRVRRRRRRRRHRR